MVACWNLVVWCGGKVVWCGGCLLVVCDGVWCGGRLLIVWCGGCLFVVCGGSGDYMMWWVVVLVSWRQWW